jgi:uncharacterized protein (TIGR00255 family)
MILSMTGFGRVEFEVTGQPFQLELRSVNHRHLDVHVRLPRAVTGSESTLRAAVAARFARGKLDVSLHSGAGQSGPGLPEVDLEAAARYVEAGRALAEQHGLSDGLDVGTLLSLPGVARTVEPQLDAEVLEAALVRAVEAAAGEVLAMRRAEGEALERDLRGRLGSIEALLADVEGRSGTVQEAARARLRKRTEQLARETGVIDEGRLHQEIVHAADRLDVTEELVRLRSHVDQFRGVLDGAEEGAAVGRKLDFLLQEMGREANTIGSKGSDAPISHAVVELKTELERVREQVQNVE